MESWRYGNRKAKKTYCLTPRIKFFSRAAVNLVRQESQKESQKKERSKKSGSWLGASKKTEENID